MTTRLLRLWPFVPTAGTVAAVWLVFSGHTFVPVTAERPRGDPIDVGILLAIGGGYLLVVAAMLWFTQRWTWRSLGQVCTYLGDVGLYGGSGLARLGWRGPLSTAEVNLVRALFVVGVALLIVGLGWWAWREQRRGGDPDDVTAAADEARAAVASLRAEHVALLTQTQAAGSWLGRAVSGDHGNPLYKLFGGNGDDHEGGDHAQRDERAVS